jgi:hypothetical protein
MDGLTEWNGWITRESDRAESKADTLAERRTRQVESFSIQLIQLLP